MPTVTTSAWIANALFDRLELFGVDPACIARDASFADHGIDAFDTALVVQEVCERYGVDIGNWDVTPETTIGEAIALVAAGLG
jgi:acyl carrier protein